jgi:hypothetical protein
VIKFVADKAVDTLSVIVVIAFNIESVDCVVIKVDTESALLKVAGREMVKLLSIDSCSKQYTQPSYGLFSIPLAAPQLGPDLNIPFRLPVHATETKHEASHGAGCR